MVVENGSLSLISSFQGRDADSFACHIGLPHSIKVGLVSRRVGPSRLLVVLELLEQVRLLLYKHALSLVVISLLLSLELVQEELLLALRDPLVVSNFLIVV